MILDYKRRKICEGNNSARLSPCEFTIVDKLLHEDGGYITRDRIAELVYWGSNEPDSSYKNITTFIHRIRTKMRKIGTEDKLISGWRDGVRYERAA